MSTVKLFFKNGKLIAFETEDGFCSKKEFGTQFQDEVDSMMMREKLKCPKPVHDWRKVDFRIDKGKVSGMK